MCKNIHHKNCKNNICRKQLNSHSAQESGFCGDECKKSHILQKALMISYEYKELGFALADDIPKISLCAREGCLNHPKDKKRKYCSMECSALSKKKIRICQKQGCSNEVKKHEKSTRFCSRECYKQHIQPSKICKRSGCDKLVFGGERPKFCSEECYKLSKFGYVIKDKKCQRDSCQNEIKGRGSKRRFCSNECYVINKKSPIGTIKLKTDGRDSRKRRFIRINSGWSLLSKYTWEKAHGPIPEGYFVRIKDGNLYNDEDLDNLELMTYVDMLNEARKCRKTHINS